MIITKRNDIQKTWSFWEKGTEKWDHLVYKTWDKALFKTSTDTFDLSVSPYSYKSIDSHDFTAFAKARLEQSPNITFIDGKVIDTEKENFRDASSNWHIDYNTGSVTARLLLDSRIDGAFFKDKKAITLQQHFKGWIIETESDTFDPDCFTMMDYTLKDPGTTSFTYILPFSKRKALVEFTYFSPKIVSSDVYDTFLKKYIEEELKVKNYVVNEIEEGLIPMSTYDFRQHNKKNHVKIGTAGGWVKPSTGYSFKSSEKKAAILVQNILEGEPLDRDIYNKKVAVYDATLLEVLATNNGKGDEIFYKMYKTNKLPALLKFLDEETNVWEDVKIMTPMTSKLFVRAFFNQLF